MPRKHGPLKNRPKKGSGNRGSVSAGNYDPNRPIDIGRRASSSGSQTGPSHAGSGGQQTALTKAKEKFVGKQRKFLARHPGENYLNSTGFIDKKWMFARWTFNHNDIENHIDVMFTPKQYIKDKNGWVKVGAVVFPLLIENVDMYNEITASGIYGCFLYTRISNNYGDGSSDGPLLYVRNMRTDSNNRGLIQAVFPYYTNGEYRTAVEFNLRNKIRSVMPRFTYRFDELESGIEQYEVNNAYDKLKRRSHKRTVKVDPETNIQIQNLDIHFSAIFVPKYAQLVVFFTNKKVKVEERIQRGILYTELRDSNKKADQKTLKELKELKQKKGFHERFLIQGGGVVSLVDYPLYFQFMSDPTGTQYEFKQLQNEFCDNPEIPITQLKDVLEGIHFPLIILRRVDDPDYESKEEMCHFAGYFLEIQNHIIEGENTEKRAILQIPTDGWFGARELGAEDNSNENSPGIEYLANQWENHVYKDFTGPIIIDDPNNPRVTHPEYVENDGSIREAFPKSDASYLAPKSTKK